MNPSIGAGLALILLLMVGIGYLSGKNVKSSADFITSGGRAGSFMVLGTILGSLAGSQATIGTAQLAFTYGLSAWWFTLGAGIGCVALGLLYAKRLRASGCVTEMQVISREYGPAAGSLGSVLGSAGIFFSVLAQTVACLSLTRTLFPSLPLGAALAAGAALMSVWVIFGGSKGMGMGGILKTVLLCLTAAASLILVLSCSGGFSGLLGSIRSLFTDTPLGGIQEAVGLSRITDEASFSARFLNLVARGPMKDVGSGVSLLLGVLSTQTYAQGIWSARSTKAARTGSLFCAVSIPFIGACCICIGLFMRSRFLLQSEADAMLAAGLAVPDLPVLAGTIQVFPTFVLRYMPPVPAGIILGTLLINVVASGAGLALGMATILTKDIYRRVTKKLDDPRKELLAIRITIVAILLVTAGIARFVSGAIINDFGFLSMGLRGTVVFLPLTLSLWLPGHVDRKYVLASIILAPCAVVVAQLIGTRIDSLFAGMFVSAVLCAAGYARKRISIRKGL